MNVVRKLKFEWPEELKKVEEEQINRKIYKERYNDNV
jgi:hypothetical protein